MDAPKSIIGQDTSCDEIIQPSHVLYHLPLLPCCQQSFSATKKQTLLNDLIVRDHRFVILLKASSPNPPLLPLLFPRINLHGFACLIFKPINQSNASV
ncbi:hypothetical protein AHF37_01885 [Paragonimus kellicotti]|nr:hypothetical protein AHF37_01885 [Paragonimus kellicotti]